MMLARRPNIVFNSPSETRFRATSPKIRSLSSKPRDRCRLRRSPSLELTASTSRQLLGFQPRPPQSSRTAHFAPISFFGQPPQHLAADLRSCGRFGPRSNHLANSRRGFEDGSDWNDATQLVFCHSRQAHRCEAPARRAVRVSPKLTRDDFGFQVGRQRLCRERENTLSGTAWRCCELPN
jgi:hypothetical protein